MGADFLTLLIVFVTFYVVFLSTDATNQVRLWSEWTECSRSCGGGVQARTRSCNHQRGGNSVVSCHSGTPSSTDEEYRVCNLQACPAGSPSFRSAQCSAYNNRRVGGQVTKKWLPVAGDWGCNLRCRSSDHKIIYFFGKAENGTRCSPENSKICVHGRCTSIGCDRRLGSAKSVDVCGVCGGRKDTCQLIRGNFQRPRLPSAYGVERVVTIPSGSTHIRVMDFASSRLVVGDSKGKTLLNGRKRYSWAGSYSVAGTTMQYQFTHNNETLEIVGPTNEELNLMVQYVHGAEPKAKIVYEFWRQNAMLSTTAIPHRTTTTANIRKRDHRLATPSVLWTKRESDGIVQKTRRERVDARNAKRGRSSAAGRNHTRQSESEWPSVRKRQIKGGRKKFSRNCPPCKRVKNMLQHFCDSDFVINAEVKGYKPFGDELRYELYVERSYKNSVALCNREFIWSPDMCRCPRLRPHRHYIIMGRVDPSFSKRESRLLVDKNSFVRRFSDRREDDMLLASRNAANCNRIT